MTTAAIQTMLAAAGIPVSCGAFPDEKGTPAPSPPYIIWVLDGGEMYGDDSVLADFSDLTVGLYTKGRDFEQEAALETILRDHGLPWHKSARAVDKEKEHLTAYEMTVLLDG